MLKDILVVPSLTIKALKLFFKIKKKIIKFDWLIETQYKTKKLANLLTRLNNY